MFNSATFVNFIAFGKRTSIDLRVVIGMPPKHFHVSAEEPNHGSEDEIALSFIEMAEKLYGELCAALIKAGYTDFVECLGKEVLGSTEFADGAQESFALWISTLYRLNNMEFIFENGAS